MYAYGITREVKHGKLLLYIFFKLCSRPYDFFDMVFHEPQTFGHSELC